MKNIGKLSITAALLCLAICGATARQTSGEPRNATIEVRYIYPESGPSIPTSDGYTLSVKDSVLDGHLPFIGTSHTNVGFGSGDCGFTFEECPIKISEKTAKDRKEWRFDAASGTEKVKITVTVWDNGSADITIIPTGRSLMRYSGELRE